MLQIVFAVCFAAMMLSFIWAVLSRSGWWVALGFVFGIVGAVVKYQL